MGRGREEVVVCMEPQVEMSRSVRGHKYHLLRALALFFSATALCVLLRQETRPGVLGRVKEPVFQNREDCDALGFQLCCVPQDLSLSHQWTSCAKGTQCHSLADTLPRDGSCCIQPSTRVFSCPHL